MSVSLADVLAGASVHAVPLTAECAGYLVLAAADQAVLAPRRMAAADLELSDDGGVRVARARACEEGESERDLRALLDELLLSASSVTPGLLRTGRRAGNGSVATLLREIETALIPVNRAAARRALARLQRETTRALESGKIPREHRADGQRAPARGASPLPPAVEVALAAIASPAPVAAAPGRPAALDVEPRSEPVTARGASRPLPPVLSIPNDPVPPPTPRAQGWLAPEPLAVLPSLTPPPASRVEAETRPEPVVQRASQRPPAAPATLPAPPPPAADSRPKTPVLGTVVAPRSAADGTGARDTMPAAPLVHVLGENGSEPHDFMLFADDLELVYLDGESGEHGGEDPTEHCPPVSSAEEDLEIAPEHHEDPAPTPLVLTERLALPIVPAVPRKQQQEATIAPDAITPQASAVEALAAFEPPVIDEPEPSPIAELARVVFAEAAHELEAAAEIDVELISEVDFAVLVDDGSELPQWASASGDTPVLTPPPRHALPKARQSDVSELIDRLGEAPLAVDELRSNLKHLAGVEPTPAPRTGVRSND